MYHPEMARELISQRARELQTQAQQRRLARTVRDAIRAQRRGQAAKFATPLIPDYVEDILGATALDHRTDRAAA
jgi:hypothetical protein